jgi:GH15 family glucan-1,4-alpha-glucosidase
MTLLYKKNKDLYDEFIMASDIMPMALFIFNSEGKLVRKNAEAARNVGENGILSDDMMCLFDVTFLKEEDKKAIRNMEPLDRELNEEQRIIIRYTSTANKNKKRNPTRLPNNLQFHNGTSHL